MSAELVAFLRARVDEDEALARAATPGPWMDELGYVTAIGPDGQVQVTDFGTQDGEPEDPTPQGNADSAHIARHGPDRVLAEVSTKRAFVDAYAEVVDMDAGNPEPEFAYGYAVGLGVAARLLALPYATHPDYRTEWAPGV